MKNDMKISKAIDTINEPIINQVIKRTTVNVKLDQIRHRALKIYGLDNHMTNQDVMVKALDLFLSKK